MIYKSLLTLLFISIIYTSCHTIKNIPEKPSAPVTKTQPVEIPQKKPVFEPTREEVKNDPFLNQLLEKHPDYFRSIIEHKKQWNVQIIYTKIDRDANNNPTLTNHYFNVNSNQYYYPASTVKLPVALMALQRLNE
ncbi:MAG: hypothetical protein ABIR81_06035, partial [Ginsengibacter sp.]